MSPVLDADDALFLDFDGTLVDIAPSPGDVVVTEALLGLLELVNQQLAGGLAIVSGRPITDLDGLLQPLVLAAVGEHGAELRSAADSPVTRQSSLPAHLATAAAAVANELPGTELEIKRASVSLHYRQAPEHADAVLDGMRGVQQQTEGYALMQGKMVVELKPQHINKGIAIRELCGLSPFAGRRPVFIGDDVTDEAGFAAVNELGGVSIRVGDIADSEAQYSLHAVADVHDCLVRMVRSAS